jgi:hypothetical protein
MRSGRSWSMAGLMDGLREFWGGSRKRDRSDGPVRPLHRDVRNPLLRRAQETPIPSTRGRKDLPQPSPGSDDGATRGERCRSSRTTPGW